MYTIVSKNLTIIRTSGVDVYIYKYIHSMSQSYSASLFLPSILYIL